MKITSLAVSGLLLVTVAGCGGAAVPTPATSARATSVASAPAASAPAAPATSTPITVKDFSLDPASLTVRSKAALAVTNAGPTVHNVSIRDASGTVVAATTDLKPGASEVLALDIAPGSFVLFCSLPGHESLGIKGRLTVTQ